MIGFARLGLNRSIIILHKQSGHADYDRIALACSVGTSVPDQLNIRGGVNAWVYRMWSGFQQRGSSLVVFF